MKKCLITAVAFFVLLQTNAQTAKDYQRAESFLSYQTAPLISKGSLSPNWLPNDKFWYRILTANGTEFILIDPIKKTRTAAFNQQKLALALTAATGKTIDAAKLPFQTFTFTTDEKAILFTANDLKWNYNLQANTIAKDESEPAAPDALRQGRFGGANEVLSPDGKKAVFIKDWNLWLKDVATKTTTALTTDGIKNYGYATDNAG